MIISTLIQSVADLIHAVIQIYIWVIIIAAVISWIRPDPYNPIIQTLLRLTEPVYAWLRRFIPTTFGGIDIAPIIVLLALQFVDRLLVKILYEISLSF
ncbi:MAG: YggT family protein [Campylobacter sp.]|nr:YggT family protein [Campylobacter sp.]